MRDTRVSANKIAHMVNDQISRLRFSKTSMVYLLNATGANLPDLKWDLV